MLRPDTSPSEGLLRLGAALVDMSRKIGVTTADIDALGQVLGEAHDRTPAEPTRDPGPPRADGRVAHITWEQIPRKGSG